jgi:hypothetical protein
VSLVKLAFAMEENEPGQHSPYLGCARRGTGISWDVLACGRRDAFLLGARPAMAPSPLAVGSAAAFAPQPSWKKGISLYIVSKRGRISAKLGEILVTPKSFHYILLRLIL